MVVVAAIRTQSRLRWWLRRAFPGCGGRADPHVRDRPLAGRLVRAQGIFGSLTVALLMVVLFAEVAAQSRSLTSLRAGAALKSEELRKAAESDPLTGCLEPQGLDARFSA